jgi:hypothetical protein
MSKMKVSRTAATATMDRNKSREWPLVVYLWAFGLALGSYVVTRIALDGYAHPYHWGSGITGGVLGIGVGWLWYRWRGDVL